MEGHLPLDQVAQSSIQPGLERFQWPFQHQHEERLVMALKTELSILPLAEIACFHHLRLQTIQVLCPKSFNIL